MLDALRRAALLLAAVAAITFAGFAWQAHRDHRHATELQATFAGLQASEARLCSQGLSDCSLIATYERDTGEQAAAMGAARDARDRYLMLMLIVPLGILAFWLALRWVSTGRLRSTPA